MLRWALIAVALLVAGLGAAGWYSFAVPGQSHSGPLPAFSTDERALADRLRAHVTAIASEPHNLAHPEAMDRAADYIVRMLREMGHAPEVQSFDVEGATARNVFVTIDASRGRPVRRSLVVGAHYDSFGEAPGANDNGTGAAAVIELARRLARLETADARLILVLFANEEPPYFRTPHMGSVHFARLLSERKEPVRAMLSLETIGFFSDDPGSQQYPKPLASIFPSTANFVAFVAMPGSRDLLHRALASFRETTAFPTIGGVAPDLIPGIGWSDHWAFAREGFEALMVTDTALFRYPHYHRPTDTPDKVDYAKLSRITLGIEHVVRALAAGARPSE
ncbi:MAG: M28 family peptidase [Hyphomicrobiaceae bacterium]|nr:M28 family peptidase [Hyphomicrobiaceae bacterium]